MAREADEPALPRPLGRLEGLDGPAGGEDPRDIVLVVDRMDLPEIHVIGPEPLQGAVELLLSPPARPLGGLGGEEHARADRRQDLAIDLLGVTVPVAVGGVEVVDAELDGPAGQGDGLLGRDEREAAAGQADDRELDARLAEGPPRDLAGFGEGWAGVGRPGAEPGEETSCQAAKECPALHGCPPEGWTSC